MGGTHKEFWAFLSASTSKKNFSDLGAEELIKGLIAEDELRTSYKRSNKSTLLLTSDETDNRHVKKSKVNFNCSILDGRLGGTNSKSSKEFMICLRLSLGGLFSNKALVKESNLGGSFLTRSESRADCLGGRCLQDKAEISLGGLCQKISLGGLCLDYASKNSFDYFPNESNILSICGTSNQIELLSDQLSLGWILDSGASIHVSHLFSLFYDYYVCESSIIVGDNREVTVHGYAKIRLKMKTPRGIKTVVLSGVGYASELAFNVISTSRLEIAGCKIVTFRGKSTVYSRREIIAVAKRSDDNLYVFDVEMESSLISRALVVQNKSSSTDWMLWHKRLGHPSNKYLAKLKPELKLAEFCEDCALCKSTNLPHMSKSKDEVRHIKDNLLKQGVVHSDLMGPININSKSGCRWIVTYLCDQTEYSFVYLMKNKNTSRFGS